MKPFLYSFFHDKTNDRTEGGLVVIPKDKQDWPDSWKNYEYKSYDRLSKVSLPRPDIDSGLINLAQKRSSAVDSLHNQKINLSNMATCLAAGYGTLHQEDRIYKPVPSAGSRYPLELYVVVWGEVDSLPCGYYHYNADQHTLSELPVTRDEDDLKNFSNHGWIRDAHGAIIISSVFDRIISKYGSRGYRYSLLEAGHVGQNICLAATEQHLVVRPLGSFNETYVEDKLQLDSSNERIVYAIVF